MKRISLVFVSVVLTCTYQMVFSQNPVIKRSALRGTGQFDITLNSKNTGESLKTHLKIPKDYELRNRIVSSITNQTKEKDELGYVHERYVQYYKGIRIEHSDIRTQYLNDKLVGVNGEYIDVPDIDVSVVISKEAAIQKAIEHIGAKKYIWEDEQECEMLRSLSSLKGDAPASCYPDPETVICMNITSKDTSFRVTYKVNIHAIDPVSSHFVYVDAKNGKILDEISRIHSFGSPIIWVPGGGTPVIGTAVTRYSGTQNIFTARRDCWYDYVYGNRCQYSLTTSLIYNNRFVHTLCKGQTSTLNPMTAGAFTNIASSNYWTATDYPSALDAHWGATVSQDYFIEKHYPPIPNDQVVGHINYFGVSPKGGGHDGEWYSGYGGYIAYDNNNSPNVTLDRIAHEFGHKNNQYTAGVGMEYFDLGLASDNYEAAYICEGLSDIFSACVQHYANNRFLGMPSKDIWLMDEEYILARSLSDPTSMGDPDTYQGTNWADSYNYHGNGCVLGHWFFILSEGKSGTNAKGFNYNVTGITIGKAEKIVYRAMSSYMTQNTIFSDARDCTIQAAIDLYGVNSTEVASVKNAWDAVGVPFIIGSSTMCIGTTATFTVANAPAGCTWDKSSNLTLIGTGNSVSVSVTGGSSGWISVKQGTVELVRHNLKVSSAPVFSSIDGPDEIELGSGTTSHYFYANFGSGAYSSPTTYSWSIGGAPSWMYTCLDYSYISLYVYFAQPATYVLYVSAHNACGSDYSNNKYVTVTDPYGYSGYSSSVSSYPNPAFDILNIEIDATSGARAQSLAPSTTGGKQLKIDPIYDLRLYDGQGNLLRNAKTKGGTVQFNVANLPNGIYYLHIYDGTGNKPEMRQIVVEH